MNGFEKIVEWLQGCGYDHKGAEKEANAMIHYHTHGVDAVSREYAIDMILSDLGLE